MAPKKTVCGFVREEPSWTASGGREDHQLDARRIARRRDELGEDVEGVRRVVATAGLRVRAVGDRCWVTDLKPRFRTSSLRL